MKKILDIRDDEIQNPPLVSHAELRAIIAMLKIHRNLITRDNLLVVVELGCYSGGTTVEMAKAVPEARIIAVDVFAINGADVRDFAINKRFPKFKNIELWEMTTVDAAKKCDFPVDIIFVDADHQKDSVERDCDNWLPHLRSGGIAIFDDYLNDDFPDVKPAVDSRTVGWEVLDQTDTIVIKRKP